MTDYKCGHKTSGIIIMDSNDLSMLSWIDWSESVGLFGDKSICYDCYLQPKMRKGKSVLGMHLAEEILKQGEKQE